MFNRHWHLTAMVSALLLPMFLAACPPSVSNHAPAFLLLADKTVAAGSTLEFSVNALDLDGDALVYSAANLPARASFTPASRLFHWQPDSSAVGNHSVQFTVRDDGDPQMSTTATVVIKVTSASSTQYDAGYDAGFALDDWYWDGFYDSYDTVDDSPVYYQGDTIPAVESPEYDRGYYDGIWYAYNDGYFVCYDYAFTVGFSEGYDAAFYSDYLDFLDHDVHVEYDNGGWGDGYNDGFSEGRIFGANDYEQGLSFDWLDALEDYRSGTDLYFAEIDLGTGVYGPVYLYEYGTVPGSKSAVQTIRPTRSSDALARVLRPSLLDAKSDVSALSRPLSTDAQSDLNYCPTTTPRASRALRLTTTWLRRVEDYLAASAKAPVPLHGERARAMSPEPGAAK